MSGKSRKPTKRNLKMRKNKRRTTRRGKKMMRKTRGGGCGCGSSSTTPEKSFFSGGSADDGYVNQATFNSGSTVPVVEGGVFNAPNPYTVAGSSTVDPTDSSSIVNSRNLENIVSGGKKQKKRRMRRLSKKRMQRGGDPILGSSFVNGVTNFGTTDGSLGLNNLLNVRSQVDSSPWVQPVASFYGPHNKVLV
jgi:hypothetical protein